MLRSRVYFPLLAGWLVLSMAASATAQTSDNVLLVINDASAPSIQIGDYYTRQRQLAADHVVHLRTPPIDGVSRSNYEGQIERPIGAWLLGHRLQDRVLYIVLTKGVPLRIDGTGGINGTVASVDSELTLLYERLLGLRPAVVGHVTNPYYLGNGPISAARPFTRRLAETFLVTRLDGFTADDVMKLIDRGVSPSRDGRIVLDERGTIIDRGGDQWLAEAAARVSLASGADRTVLGTTSAVAHTSGAVLGYYSWGSNDAAIRSRRTGLAFTPGAIGGSFVSTDGRTFDEPPADWMFSDPNGRGPSFAGSFQSLAGDLIRDGITGLAANVAEPYLDATARPQILFPAYLAGFNLAESYYLSLPYLSWQGIVIGDPLCAPFRDKTPTRSEPDDRLDPDTELPALFSARQMALLSRDGFNVDAVKLVLKAEAHVAVGHASDEDALLRQAVDFEPRLTTANLTLAAHAETAGDFPGAADRYRRVLAIDPKNVVALNNLAFNLADKQHDPKDALPFAERAYQLSGEPTVADTLGWVDHLLGDNASAARLVEAAAAPGDVGEILLHAAVVHEALDDRERARRELAAALKLDDSLKSRPDVVSLIDRLKRPANSYSRG